METYTCKSCHQTKPLDEFYLRQKNPPLYKTRCKECVNAYQKTYQKTPQGRELQRQRCAEWRVKNLDLARKLSREGNRKARKEDPRRFKSYELKSHYGISLEEYEALLAKQNGKCAICGATEPRGAGMFHVDHCHNSSKIRGLLCSECNMGIGKLKDDPERVLRAASYLAEGS